MTDEPTNEPQGRVGALAALREVAEDSDLRQQFGAAVASFVPEDYEQIVALAWRYQFDDDRSKFKRELRELQEQVSRRILARLELGQ
ncbi:hypothetical protein [Actinocatenispora comari]|uniref:Uncharacterized protein n=1 Tax=Actinocatenispora comari TaxID=2807577 RepID=A0A8J4EPX4_9ACTN|nr:hypothetical protein [Actinocatenispora comari]GIL29184.1 hypothetical protein NUM_44380 [Actinocatenispora comari]